MKTALVTGADGFIGSHLCELLLRNGYRVKALSLYNSFNYWGWLEDFPGNPNLQIISGDVRDPAQMRALMKDVDIVFHLAALIAIPYSYSAPDSYVDTNVRGTLNICQAAREKGDVRVLITSTSEVYGTAQYVPIDENHPRQAQSPYSASKIAADALAMSFYNSFDLPLTVVRPFNTYGPRQSARAIIPTLITQIADGIREIKTGDLRPTRDFNFVADTAAGFLAIAENELTIGQEINIASNYEISMQEVLGKIITIMGKEVKIIEDQERLRPAKSEVFRLWGDNRKITELCGWKPQIDLDEGLAITCRWFQNKENLKKYKSGLYNT